jgi:sugar/nucleoside kinase (ribokinase family)
MVGKPQKRLPLTRLPSSTITMKKIVTFGEIMLRLESPGLSSGSPRRTASRLSTAGGESNVAVSLANFGLSSTFVSRIPANDIGECAIMELRKRGVDTTKVIRGGERLGIYFLETGAVSRGSKVIYDRAHSGMATIEKGMIDWEEVLRGRRLVPLDGHHPRHLPGGGRCLPGSHPDGQSVRGHGIDRPQLPQKTLEIR